jgi:hypothetical protein
VSGASIDIPCSRSGRPSASPRTMGGLGQPDCLPAAHATGGWQGQARRRRAAPAMRGGGNEPTRRGAARFARRSKPCGMARRARTDRTAARSPGLRTRGQAPPASAGERDQAAFPEGQEGPFAAPDDDVVQDLDVEDLTRLHELASDAKVLSRRRRIARRVIVTQHDGASPIRYGGPEDLTRMYQRSVRNAE